MNYKIRRLILLVYIATMCNNNKTFSDNYYISAGSGLLSYSSKGPASYYRKSYDIEYTRYEYTVKYSYSSLDFFNLAIEKSIDESDDIILLGLEMNKMFDGIIIQGQDSESSISNNIFLTPTINLYQQPIFFKFGLGFAYGDITMKSNSEYRFASHDPGYDKPREYQDTDIFRLFPISAMVEFGLHFELTKSIHCKAYMGMHGYSYTSDSNNKNNNLKGVSYLNSNIFCGASLVYKI